MLAYKGRVNIYAETVFEILLRVGIVQLESQLPKLTSQNNSFSFNLLCDSRIYSFRKRIRK